MATLRAAWKNQTRDSPARQRLKCRLLPLERAAPLTNYNCLVVKGRKHHLAERGNPSGAHCLY